MATFNVSSLTAYKNQIGGDIFTKAVLPANLLSQGVDVITGIKGTQSLNLMDDYFYLKAGGCALHTNSGLTTFTQRDITVCPLKLERDFCLNELETYWQGAKFRGGSKYTDLDFLQGSLLGYIEDKLAETNEYLLWQGVSGGANANANLNLCDGIIKVISGETSRITTGTTTLTTSNIIDYVNKFVGAIPEVLLAKDLTLFVAPSTYRMYLQALAAANYYHMFAEFATSMSMPLPVFGNVKITATSGLAGTAYMVLTYPDNIVIGTDLESEMDQVEIWYSQDYNVVKARAQYKLGVQIKYPEYVIVNY